MSTSTTDQRRDFRLGFFDLNTVHVQPLADLPGPIWLEAVRPLSMIVDQLEEDWNTVAALGGTLPSGQPVSRGAILTEIGVPQDEPTGILGRAACVSRVTVAGVALCAKAAVAAAQLRTAARRSSSP